MLNIILMHINNILLLIFQKNRLEVFNDKKWQNFIGEIHHQWQFGGNDINIIHFGGSHIQADVWTNR